MTFRTKIAALSSFFRRSQRKCDDTDSVASADLCISQNPAREVYVSSRSVETLTKIPVESVISPANAVSQLCTFGKKADIWNSHEARNVFGDVNRDTLSGSLAPFSCSALFCVQKQSNCHLSQEQSEAWNETVTGDELLSIQISNSAQRRLPFKALPEEKEESVLSTHTTRSNSLTKHTVPPTNHSSPIVVYPWSRRKTVDNDDHDGKDMHTTPSDSSDGDSECSVSCDSEMTSVSRRKVPEVAQQPSAKHSGYTQMYLDTSASLRATSAQRLKAALFAKMIAERTENQMQQETKKRRKHNVKLWLANAENFPDFAEFLSLDQEPKPQSSTDITVATKRVQGWQFCDSPPPIAAESTMSCAAMHDNARQPASVATQRNRGTSVSGVLSTKATLPRASNKTTFIKLTQDRGLVQRDAPRQCSLSWRELAGLHELEHFAPLLNAA